MQEAYCEVLSKYKVELSKPFDEARTFLSKIERQLSNLCKDASSPSTNTCGGNEQSGKGYFFMFVFVFWACLTGLIHLVIGVFSFYDACKLYKREIYICILYHVKTYLIIFSLH